MIKCSPCPLCGDNVRVGYACGDYFINSENPECPVCGIEYTEMHASEKPVVDAWEKRVKLVKELMERKEANEQ